MLKTGILLFILVFPAKVLFAISGNYTILNGFALGQFRDVPTRVYGKPYQTGEFDSGYPYDAFIITKDTGEFMIFEYTKGDGDIISSIQYTGLKSNSNTGFNNLSFGMDEESVIRLLGKPTDKINIGEYGYRWDYENSNVSVEISVRHKLTSIKIKSKLRELTKADYSSVPTIDSLFQWVRSENNKAISAMVSPGLQVYLGDSVIHFSGNWSSETEKDQSHIYHLISELIANLDPITFTDPRRVNSQMRLVQNQDPVFVIRFTKYRISEIAIRMEMDGFKIYKIYANY